MIKTERKMQLVVTVGLVLLVAFICWSMGRSGGGGDGSSIPKEYTVTKSTGLYNAFDIDADMIAELSVGTKVRPATGNALSCNTITELGTTYELCRVTVIDSGKTGWVLRKWIK